jgi:hypothetical protein
VTRTHDTLAAVLVRLLAALELGDAAALTAPAAQLRAHARRIQIAAA